MFPARFCLLLLRPATPPTTQRPSSPHSGLDRYARRQERRRKSVVPRSTESDVSGDPVLLPSPRIDATDEDLNSSSSAQATRVRNLERMVGMLQAEVGSLRQERDQLKEKLSQQKFDPTSTDKKTRFHTVIPTVAAFMWLLTLLDPFIKDRSVISKKDQVILTLMKLRLGLQNQDLAYRTRTPCRTSSMTASPSWLRSSSS